MAKCAKSIQRIKLREARRHRNKSVQTTVKVSYATSLLFQKKTSCGAIKILGFFMRFHSSVSFIREFALKRMFSRNLNFHCLFEIEKNFKKFWLRDLYSGERWHIWNLFAAFSSLRFSKWKHSWHKLAQTECKTPINWNWIFTNKIIEVLISAENVVKIFKLPRILAFFHDKINRKKGDSGKFGTFLG